MNPFNDESIPIKVTTITLLLLCPVFDPLDIHLPGRLTNWRACWLLIVSVIPLYLNVTLNVCRITHDMSAMVGNWVGSGVRRLRDAAFAKGAHKPRHRQGSRQSCALSWHWGPGSQSCILSLLEVQKGKHWNAPTKMIWRCPQQFPYCDGSHAKHNQVTGDNIGPLIIKRKEWGSTLMQDAIIMNIP